MLPYYFQKFAHWLNFMLSDQLKYLILCKINLQFCIHRIPYEVPIVNSQRALI